MSGIDEELLRYMDAQQQRRHDRVQATLGAMTDRERCLVREAAVMGYVRGMYAGNGGICTPPPDTWVQNHVIECCFGFPDLYPTMTALTNSPEEVTP